MHMKVRFYVNLRVYVARFNFHSIHRNNLYTYTIPIVFHTFSVKHKNYSNLIKIKCSGGQKFFAWLFSGFLLLLTILFLLTYLELRILKIILEIFLALT